MAVRKTNVLKKFDHTWVYSARADDDKKSARLRYVDDFQGWGSRCPLLGSDHPDIPSFKLAAIDAERVEGDQIAVVLSYEAAAWGASYPGKNATADSEPRYSIETEGSEEILIAAEYFSGLAEEELKALGAIINGSLTDESGTPWENSLQSDRALEALALYRKGVTSCKKGSFIYSERKVVNSLSDVQAAKIFTIDAPPGPGPAAIGASANNWLYIGASAAPDSSGDYWTLERRWAYSRYGWNTLLYGDGAGGGGS